MFSSPVTISNRIPPTSSSSDSRSSACAGERTGGQREQLRRHRPQLRQHHRHEHQPEPDVQALGEPVEPRRRGRPVEPGQVQEPDVARDRLPELRAVGDVVSRPVTITTGSAASRTAPNTEVSHGPRSGLRKRGSGGRCAPVPGRPGPTAPPTASWGPGPRARSVSSVSPSRPRYGGRRPGARAYRSVTCAGRLRTASRGYAGPVAARVLVVDDDATVRDVVARYLGDAGYRVDLAGDGDGRPARRRARPARTPSCST